MKKIVSLALLCALLLGAFVSAQAAITGDPVMTFKGPFLLTNAGQGAGGKLARLLIKQSKAVELDKDFFYDAEPGKTDKKGAYDFDKVFGERPYTALVAVIGSTDKGLGASGITIDDEIDRLNQMVAYAKEKKIPIVAVLLEKDKRSDIKTNANERSIDAIAPNADWIIVIKDGNLDGRFDKIKEEHKIPLTILDNNLDFGELAKQAFQPAP